MRFCFFIVYIAIFLLVISCKKEKNIINEWQNREIIFPEKTTFIKFLNDTTGFYVPQSKLKVLVYADSTGCIGCKLQLSEWKEFIQNVDSITGRKIPFLFFFYLKDTVEVKFLLEVEQFDYPVYIDSYDQLNQMNRFPTDILFQTFLLDENNRVLLIGNPIYDAVTKEKYLEKISNNEKEEDRTDSY